MGFAVVMIVGALAIGFSTGSASIITRAIGAGNKPLFTALGAEGRLMNKAAGKELRKLNVRRPKTPS